MGKVKISELENAMRLLRQISIVEKDKLSYAVKRNIDKIYKACKPANEELADELEVAEIELASADEIGNLIVERKRISPTEEKEFYSYTVANKLELKRRKAESRKSFQNKEVDFEPYLCQDMDIERIDLIDEITIEDLTGFLFKAKDDQEIGKFENGISA